LVELAPDVLALAWREPCDQLLPCLFHGAQHSMRRKLLLARKASHSLCRAGADLDLRSACGRHRERLGVRGEGADLPVDKPHLDTRRHAIAAAIRAAFDHGGELSAADELRRVFSAITDIAQARESARTLAAWKPLPMPLRPSRLRLGKRRSLMPSAPYVDQVR
jgi:hypothetical protein